MRLKEILLIVVFFFCLTLVYLFPLTQGLILLPLDLLISNYGPWYSPGTILLKNPYMQDSIIQLYPWKHLVFQSFQNWIIPFWNPYQHLGMPFMASMKSMVFYPLNILYLLGEVRAWNILLFLQIFLSMFFSYILARDFKLKILPSVLVSFIFSLNSLMIGVLEFGSEGHILLWGPIFFLCAKKYLEKQQGKYLFILGITLAASILAGQLQYTGYVLIVLMAFILFYGYTLKVKIQSYILLLFSIFLGFGLTALQLIPSLELFSQSLRGVARSYDVFASGLIKPYYLFRLFSPDFFGNPVTRDSTIGYIETSGYFGIISLFFVLYSIFFIKKNFIVRFFSIVFIAAILLSLDKIGPMLYFLKIPFIASGSGGRIFSLVYFSGSLLSGFGVLAFISNNRRKRDFLFLISFILFFIGTILLSISFNLLDAAVLIKNIKFSAIILGIFSFACTLYLYKKNNLIKILFLIFVVFLTFFDLFRLGYRFLTFSNKKFLYPQTSVTKYVQDMSKGTLGRNIGLTEPELATYLNIYTTETYSPLYLVKTGILMNYLQNRPKSENLPGNKYFVTLKTDNLKYAMDFLGVSSVVTGKDSNPTVEYFSKKSEADFALVFKDEKHAVYKNKTAYPRFNLYYEVYKLKNDEEALDVLSKKTINFKKKVIVHEDMPLNFVSGSGSAKLISSNVNNQKFSIKTDKPALFYISDTYFPGWTALVNGKESKIYRANYNFRSVIVPSGESMLEFNYIPTGFKMGVLISMVSFLILLGLTILHKKILSIKLTI